MGHAPLRSGVVAGDITEIIGVYDADSTLIGEVSYWVKARFGAAHCSLCDLTHGLFTPKKEWTECARSLGVPVTTYHRNDAPREVLAAATGFPILLVRTRDRLQVVADHADLARFDGQTRHFVQWLEGIVSQGSPSDPGADTWSGWFPAVPRQES